MHQEGDVDSTSDRRTVHMHRSPRGLAPAVSTDLDPETRRRRDAHRLQQLANAAIVDPSGFVFSPVVDWEWMGDTQAAQTSQDVQAGRSAPLALKGRG